jgi:hypothetical protein
MVLDNDADRVGVGELGELAQAVGREFLLLFASAVAGGVDANHGAAQHLGGLDPLVVVLDRRLPARRVGIAELPFTIHHDQVLVHAGVLRPCVHLGKVGCILRLVPEELVDVLDGLDAELLLCDAGEVEVLELALLQRPMEGPLRERDPERWRGAPALGPGVPDGWEGGSRRGRLEEPATRYHA